VFTVFKVFRQFIRPSQPVSRLNEETLLPITIYDNVELPWLFVIIMLRFYCLLHVMFIQITDVDIIINAFTKIC